MARLKYIKDLTKGIKLRNGLRRYAHENLWYLDHPRPRANIHASSLTGTPEYCPRHQALLDLTGKKDAPKRIDPCLAYTFALGRLLERHAITSIFKDIAFADWECDYCSTMHFFQLNPKKCRSCGSKNLTPVEKRFKDPHSGTSCGVDMFVKLPQRKKLTPVEVKTESQDKFVELKAPRSEHRQRSLLYLEIMDLDKENIGDQVDLSSIIVFYMLKGYGKSDPTLSRDVPFEKLTPFKEYEISRDPDVAATYLSKAKDYSVFLRDKAVPFRLSDCATVSSPRAKKCNTCKECFSTSYPQGEVHSAI